MRCSSSPRCPGTGRSPACGRSLPGFPGYGRNLDLAHAFRRAGWTALVFHYRGAWGSQGEFTFGHVLEDVRSALAFVRSGEARRDLQLDAERVALVGHSMGG